MLVGNNKYYKIRLGKQDANYGTLLRNNGKGDLEYIPQKKSGFTIKGDVKSVVKSNKNLIFGVNEANILTYKYTNQ